MGLQIYPGPPDLCFDFFGRNTKVGICSGDIYRDDAPLGYYLAASYFETQEDLALMVTIGRQKTHGRFSSELSIGAKCPVGNPEAFYPVGLDQVPWDESFLFQGFVAPDDYPSYSLAAEAFGLIGHIVNSDANIRAYLKTGEAVYAYTDISQAGIYGLNEHDPWPYDYVIAALQILALPPKWLNAYMPRQFPDWFYADANNQAKRGTMLEVLYALQQAIEKGQRWNEWIFDTMLMDPDIESEFAILEGQLEKLCAQYREAALPARDIELNDKRHPCYLAMRNCRRLAQRLLAKTGWFKRHAPPVMACIDFVDEFAWT